MSIFGGEKYSKERFSEAKEERDISFEQAKSLGTRTSVENPISEDTKSIVNKLWVNHEKARRKVDELYGKGQAEAIVLNEEYDRLVARAQEAVKAVEDFEKEKLGMSGEN